MEKRNAICMICGRVSPLKTQSSCEELAVMFEGSSTSGAMRAYGKALDKLARKMVDAGALHAVDLRRTSQKKTSKKITAAVYEYFVDCDGEWGRIHLNFSAGTAEIKKVGELEYDVDSRFRQPCHLVFTVSAG